MEMTFDPPLVRGTLIRRYKRFLADVRLDTGEEIIAHCPNPGSMRTCAEPGWTAWVSPATNPKRKLKWTLELIESDTARIMVNTARPNKIVEAAIREGQIEELAGYETIRPEVKYGENSRIDLLLSSPDRADCYVEIKNVTLLHSPDTASFPDSVSKRAAKHMRELAAMTAEGHRSVVFFLVSRSDVTAMRPADDIDPAYGVALRAAIAGGVEAIAHGLCIGDQELTISGPLNIQL